MFDFTTLVFSLTANVLHIAVRAGFSVENSKRATKLKFTNKFQTEALCPPDGNMFFSGSAFHFLLANSISLSKLVFSRFCSLNKYSVAKGAPQSPLSIL